MGVAAVLTLPILMLSMLLGALGVLLVAVVAGLWRLLLAGVGTPFRLGGARGARKRGVPVT